jgi:PhnB protein
MTTVNAYLNFRDTCEEAFKAYEKILGGKIIAMVKAETPDMGGPDFVGKIMHARMMVGTAVLMGSDSPQNRERTPQGFAVNVTAETPAEADRIYTALAEGGQQMMPIAETFWAHRFGMCVDRFGTPWMVNCEKLNMGRP